MKALLKVAITIAIIFASTFVIAKMFGILTIDQVKSWLEALQSAHPLVIASVVAGLLFLDLFVAIPNLTVTILGGYFLGFVVGATAAVIGASLSGIVGYWMSYYYGDRILNVLLKDETERRQIVESFASRGFLMILCARAVPILPEVTACLAGITKMKFSRFLLAWSISTIPYCLIAAYAGSISSLENPKPALFTAVAVTVGLWIVWRRYQRVKSNSPLLLPPNLK